VFGTGLLVEQVDAMIADAFRLHLAVATYRPANLEPRLSAAPYPRELRHSNSPAAVALQAAAKPLHEYSDGVQVFTGLVSAVSSLPHKLMLIDEPEAFLHPTLASRLGQHLARIASERSGNLVAATHSAEFLLGCVTRVPETTVVRLTYANGEATARALEGIEVQALIQNPLLRSAEALRALFAEGAAICEADSDRAFYEEINRRLRDAGGRDHAADTIFLNAQNWQTIAILAEPLRARVSRQRVRDRRGSRGGPSSLLSAWRPDARVRCRR
jgi:hypothetical protein